MLIFMDDSGDPGFKLDQGSTRFFVIVLIIFDDDLDAMETQLNIKKLKRELNLPEDFEFCFNKTSKVFRHRFLQTAAACKFRFRAIVFDKTTLYGRELRRSKEKFYNYAIKQVLQNDRGTIREAKLRFDSHGEKVVRQELVNYLRRELNTPSRRLFKDLKFINSSKDELIQLADMIAGSIRRSSEGKTPEDKSYLEVVKVRKDNIWYFG